MSVSDNSAPRPGASPGSASAAAGAESLGAEDLLRTRFMLDFEEYDEGFGRRRFLYISSALATLAGASFFVWPFVHSMNPAADVEAAASTEVDLSTIETGEAVTVVWRGKPVFIRHRTPEEILSARRDDDVPMPDPQTDEARTQRPEWLVAIGICNHLGCVPRGQRANDPKGDYGGWFCPCHGSHFDTSGRVRKGPAPTNLTIPEYVFIDDEHLRIG